MRLAYFFLAVFRVPVALGADLFFLPAPLPDFFLPKADDQLLLYSLLGPLLKMVMIVSPKTFQRMAAAVRYSCRNEKLVVKGSVSGHSIFLRASLSTGAVFRIPKIFNPAIAGACQGLQ